MAFMMMTAIPPFSSFTFRPSSLLSRRWERDNTGEREGGGKDTGKVVQQKLVICNKINGKQLKAYQVKKDFIAGAFFAFFQCIYIPTFFYFGVLGFSVQLRSTVPSTIRASFSRITGHKMTAALLWRRRRRRRRKRRRRREGYVPSPSCMPVPGCPQSGNTVPFRGQGRKDETSLPKQGRHTADSHIRTRFSFIVCACCSSCSSPPFLIGHKAFFFFFLAFHLSLFLPLPPPKKAVAFFSTKT